MSRYRCEKCGEERASHKKTHDSKGIHAFNNYTCAPLNEVHPSANNGQRKFAMRYFEKIYWKRYIIRDAWHDTYELKKIHRGNVSICFMIMNTRKNIVLQSEELPFVSTDIKGRFIRSISKLGKLMFHGGSRHVQDQNLYFIVFLVRFHGYQNWMCDR